MSDDICDLARLLYRWREGGHEVANVPFVLKVPESKFQLRYAIHGERSIHSPDTIQLVIQLDFRRVGLGTGIWRNRRRFFAIAGKRTAACRSRGARR